MSLAVRKSEVFLADLVRVMHGARDLPKRLRQPPGAEAEESAPR